MKQRFRWAILILSVALMSACGVPASPTVNSGPTGQPTVATPVPSTPTNVPIASGQPTLTPVSHTAQFSLESLVALKPTDVLLQLEYEPSFTTPEFMQPFGRIAQFTLLADGGVLYINETMDADTAQQQVMRAQLTPEETVAMVQHYLDARLAQVESYNDLCEPGEGENRTCIADAAYTITRIRLPNGTLHESRNYAHFAVNGDILTNVVEQMQNYTNEQASEYQPEQATLFIRPIAEQVDGIPTLEWPLTAEWLAAPREGLDQWAKVVEGDDLATLLETVPYSNGMYWFTSGEQLYQASLAPWLPGQDYREGVEAYQMPPAKQPAPTTLAGDGEPTSLPVQP